MTRKSQPQYATADSTNLPHLGSMTACLWLISMAHLIKASSILCPKIFTKKIHWQRWWCSSIS